MVTDFRFFLSPRIFLVRLPIDRRKPTCRRSVFVGHVLTIYLKLRQWPSAIRSTRPDWYLRRPPSTLPKIHRYPTCVRPRKPGNESPSQCSLWGLLTLQDMPSTRSGKEWHPRLTACTSRQGFHARGAASSVKPAKHGLFPTLPSWFVFI